VANSISEYQQRAFISIPSFPNFTIQSNSHQS
jgi:hypothetical protein